MPHPDPDMLGLGIQQPWAELILRGIKTIEVRNAIYRRPGPIYLYASKRLSELPCAQQMIEEYDLNIADLPRGMVVGTVEVKECRPSQPTDATAACVPADLLVDRYSWILTNVKRLEKPCRPLNSPYGMWFRPFHEFQGRERRRRRST